MRGSALESLDRSSRRRPSRGRALRSLGKDTENRGVDGGGGSARRNCGTMAAARRISTSMCNDRRDVALQIFILSNSSPGAALGIRAMVSRKGGRKDTAFWRRDSKIIRMRRESRVQTSTALGENCAKNRAAAHYRHLAGCSSQASPLGLGTISNPYEPL